ncbi:unnamed protein product [Alopecurus aequalis]
MAMIVVGVGVEAETYHGAKLRTGCWTGLQLEVEPEVQALYDASVRISVGDGRTALFWTDAWLGVVSFKHLAPALYAAVDPRAIRSRTVGDGLTNRRWIRDITGPLSVPVLVQFVELLDSLQAVVLTPGIPDRVIWKWTSSATYSASSAYRALFAGLEFFPCGKTIWHAWAPSKCKIHIWLAMQRRIWTADRMRRRGMNTHTSCPLCDQEPETADHIAVGCVLAREVWHATLSRCNLHHLTPEAGAALIDWWPEARLRVPRQSRKGFDSIVLLTVWVLWKERNSRVFDCHATTLLGIRQRIAEEVELWKQAGAVGLGLVWQ